MARTGAQVLDELLAISPGGDALPPGRYGWWAQLLAPLGDALAAAEQLDDTLLWEVDPRTALHLLADFERVLGPDRLGRDQGGLDIGQRRQLAWWRWTCKGGCTPAFYQALAASFGEAITIDTFAASQCGPTVCGDELAPQGDELTWRVNLPADAVFTPVCGAAECGDPLGALLASGTSVAAAITLYAQPHTLVLFNYTS